ncbi:ATP-dependent translocase ABCB1 [Lamellibrachia satsuma]|nr:ATP-dependent translocase ABCB1 [Lamellibrachia satsuma]
MVILAGSMSLGQSLPNLEGIATAGGSAQAIFEVIDTKPQIDSRSDNGLKPDHLLGNIELKNVDFVYESRPEIKVLDQVSLKMEVGQTIALVGSSGSGKSTICHLLLRLYDSTVGQLTIDGYDIKDINVKWLRQEIGVVSQEPVLFDGSISDNIRLGREGATPADIENAAKMANAHNFIMMFPDKYDTLVGQQGTQMSGGQKQRIAIARALISNPKILLLDEATSALDSESEAIVQDALEKASRGRTTIVVAHRLSTIRNADVIHCLTNGRIVESGSHDELMNQEGPYYELVTSQEGGDKSVFLRLLKLNAAEWPYITIGCFTSFCAGSVPPMFAFVYSLMMKHWSWATVGENLTVRLRKVVFSRMLQQEIGWFDLLENKVGVLTSRLAVDATIVRGAGGNQLGLMVLAASSLVVAFVVAFVASWKLCLAVLVFLPFLFAAGLAHGRDIKGSAERAIESAEQGGKIASEAISNIRTVAALTVETKFEEKFNIFFYSFVKKERIEAARAALFYGFSQSIPQFAYVVAFYYGAHLVSQGEIEFDNIFRVALALIMASMSTGRATSFAPDAYKAREAAKHIFDLLDRKPRIEICADDAKFPSILEDIPKHDVLVILGDFNARFGSDNTNRERIMGKHGTGTMTNNGSRLCDICGENDLVIGGTLFQHKTIHKLTWRSPDGRTESQIDHILVNGKWRRSLQDVKTRRLADAGSDHNLLIGKLALKLRKAKTGEKKKERLDTTKLQNPET